MDLTLTGTRFDRQTSDSRQMKEPDAVIGQTTHAEAPSRLLRLADVKLRTGMTRSTIYRWMQDGRFPKSRRLDGRIAVWVEAEVEAWIRSTLEH